MENLTESMKKRHEIVVHRVKVLRDSFSVDPAPKNNDAIKHQERLTQALDLLNKGVARATAYPEGSYIQSAILQDVTKKFEAYPVEQIRNSVLIQPDDDIPNAGIGSVETEFQKKLIRLDDYRVELEKRGEQGDALAATKAGIFKNILTQISSDIVVSLNLGNNPFENRQGLRKNIESAITSYDNTNQLAEHRGIAKQNGTAILNVLCVVTVLPALIKLGISGSLFKAQTESSNRVNDLLDTVSTANTPTPN